jgi:hypothetical protein
MPSGMSCQNKRFLAFHFIPRSRVDPDRWQSVTGFQKNNAAYAFAFQNNGRCGHWRVMMRPITVEKGERNEATTTSDEDKALGSPGCGASQGLMRPKRLACQKKRDPGERLHDRCDEAWLCRWHG